MNIIIFGASGGTGRHLVTQALTQGHQVTAFVRNPDTFDIRHPKLQVLQGDVLHLDAVTTAVKGHDAVLCALGRPANKTGQLRSAGTLNIIRAMQQTGINRLICQTSLGYGDSKTTLKRTPFIFRHIIVPYLLKKGFADHALQEQHIRESNLDWVIVRPGNLTDTPPTGKYRHGFAANDPHITVKVARADVADFMLKQLTSDQYLHKTPGLSY